MKTADGILVWIDLRDGHGSMTVKVRMMLLVWLG